MVHSRNSIAPCVNFVLSFPGGRRDKITIICSSCKDYLRGLSLNTMIGTYDHLSVINSISVLQGIKDGSLRNGMSEWQRVEAY